MRKIIILILVLITEIPVMAQTGRRIIILHTNDLHSRLNGYSPESAYSPLSVNDDRTVGGFARIATLIKSEKENNEGTTVAVDAGDFLMGTLFQSLEVETGFQLRLMKTMGYDVTCLGNHEFDFGPEKLAILIRNSVKSGGIPALLIGNSEFSDKDAGDDGLEQLYSENILSRSCIITRDNIRIGFFSILGKDADNVSPEAAPVRFSKQIPFARKMVKELKDKKCDIIICISHSGLTRNKNGEWDGEDADLARAVNGIDLIVSGHTHSRLDEPFIINNIPIVQAGEYGKFVGRMSFLYSQGRLDLESYKLIEVDDKIRGDANVDRLIGQEKARITKEILAPIGLDYDKPVAESSFTIEGNEMGDFRESNLGPLIADAIQYYVNRHEADGTDISIVAAGVIRDNIIPGSQTAPDIFRIMSLGSGNDNVPGYPLSRLYVTGKELKSILEILQVAYKSTPDNYCYYSGLMVEYDPGKGFLRKIKNIEIVHADSTMSSVDFSRKAPALYSVTANSYILEFFGIIRKMSLGLINVVPKDINGNRVYDMKTAVMDMDEGFEGVQEGKEWLALMEYLGSMKDTNGNGIPDIDKKYAVPVKCFFPVKSE